MVENKSGNFRTQYSSVEQQLTVSCATFLPRLKTCHHHNYHFPQASLHGFPILIDFFMIKIKPDKQALPLHCASSI